MIRVDRRFWRLTPQEVDPLTWLTGDLVPLVFGALNVVYGMTFVVLNWSLSDAPFLQVAGVALGTAACLLVHLLSSPLRAPFGWTGALAVLGVAALGFILSAIGFAGSALPLETWSAPLGLAFAIASLGPYLPARAVLVMGAGALVVAAPVAAILAGLGGSDWGPVATIIIVISPAIVGTVIIAAFSITVVSRFVPLIEARSRTLLMRSGPRGLQAERAERERVARLTARAVPFLRAVAESGQVTAADRTLAGQLARRLRDDLVTQSNLTWLDSVAADSRVVVVDPEHRAARMRGPQRTTLRALLRAILNLPGADAGSLLVELRPHEDGSTVVGISLDIDLPEGRRIMHLAPYYLALRGTVDDLQWRQDDQFLRVNFNLPPSQD